MQEIQRGVFTRETGPRLQNSLTTLYVYRPPEYLEEGLREDIVVAKPPNHPQQYFIGPQEDVMSIAKGFEILDCFGYYKIRAMNVLVTKRYDYESQNYKELTGGSIFTIDLLKRFGILESIKGSRYSKTPIENIGIREDVKHPLFSMYGLEDWRKADHLYAAIHFSHVAIHEWTHCQQRKQGLPVNSLWAERAADTKRCLYLLELLKSGKLSLYQEKLCVADLRHYSTIIYNYRNGKGFANHLTRGSNTDGSPQKNQTLYTKDFKFGY